MLVLEDSGIVSYLGELTSNRRKAKRVILHTGSKQSANVAFLKKGILKKELPMELVNLSHSGVLAKSSVSLTTNDKVLIELQLDNKVSKRVFQRKAHVVRRVSEDCYAIQFQKPLEEVDLYSFQYKDLKYSDRRKVAR